MRGCLGGGMHGCRGACVVGGHALLPGGMCGCGGGGVCMVARGHVWLSGGCMVAWGACVVAGGVVAGGHA